MVGGKDVGLKMSELDSATLCGSQLLFTSKRSEKSSYKGSHWGKKHPLLGEFSTWGSKEIFAFSLKEIKDQGKEMKEEFPHEENVRGLSDKLQCSEHKGPVLLRQTTSPTGCILVLVLPR